MADVSEPISALPAASTVQPTDLYIISQDNGDGTYTSKKAASSIVQTAAGNVTASAVLTANAPIIGGGGKTISALAAMTNGQIVIGATGSAPSPQTISGDITLTSLGVATVAAIQGKAISGTTGTVNVVYSNSPALVTPALGTPSALVLTNATGLPVSTGVSGLGTGVATFLATPSSANLRAALTDETGTGAAVFANTPSLITPDLGAATGSSVTVTGVLKGGKVWQSARNAYTSFAGLLPSGTSSATKVQMGLGSSWSLTPSFSGRVRIIVSGWCANSALGNTSVNANFGTGTAPSNGAALSGTAFNATDILATPQVTATNAAYPLTLISEATGLTLATAYWFDMTVGSSGGTSQLRVQSVIIEEL